MIAISAFFTVVKLCASDLDCSVSLFCNDGICIGRESF